MRISNKNVWPLLDNQKVKEESLVDKLQREVNELQAMNNRFIENLTLPIRIIYNKNGHIQK